jgi:hypothetical protein
MREPQTIDNYVDLTPDNQLKDRGDAPKPFASVAGTLKDDVTGAAVAAADIVAEGLVITHSNAAGEFVIGGINPEVSLVLTVLKTGYYDRNIAYSRAELRDANGGAVNKDVKLVYVSTAENVTVTGNISNVVNGGVAGAQIVVEGVPSVSAVSTAGGGFTLGGVPLLGDTVLIISKAGYENAAVVLPAEDVADGAVNLPEIDLCQTYSTSLPVGGARNIGHFELQITRSRQGIEFLYTAQQLFTGEDKVYLYLYYGANKPVGFWMSASGRIEVDKKNIAEFAHPSLSPVTFTVTQNDNAQTGASVAITVPFALLGMNENDTFRFSAGVSTIDGNNLADWDGMSFNGFIDPDIFEYYVKADSANALSR